MGKGRSPAKWLKNLLSGKKSSSKSNASKKSDIFKISSNKDVLGSSEVSVSDPTVDSLVISAPISGSNDTKGVISEKEVVSWSSHDKDVLSTGDEQAHVQAIANGSPEDLEELRLAEAAITVQAACRGYQARKTFQRLKVIIQLQALIRGHLVRRQAVSALYCVKGIVKFQALARGYNVRRSDIGLEVLKIRKDTQSSNSVGVVTSTQAEKFSESAFVQKLLASSSYAVPLSLNCDLGEPNASKWLDLWTSARFWAPLLELKKKLESVSDEKNVSQTVERGKVKRKTQKSPVVKAGDGSNSGSNKQKQRPKKDSNHSLPSAWEHTQKESEKSSSKKARTPNSSDRSEVVTEKRKHNLKKISEHTVTDVSEQGPIAPSEKTKDSTPPPKLNESNHEKGLVTEKRKHNSKKISDHTVTDVSEQGPIASSEKTKDLTPPKSNESNDEKGLGQQAKDDNNSEPHNDTIAVSQTSAKKGGDEIIQGVTEDLNGGDSCISNNCQRRASLPANFSDRDNELQNTPSPSPRLPSYMAPTESAKAKLRAQGSPRFATDLIDKSSLTRRHSLSSSLNGKSGSFSPRAERLIAMTGKGALRTDRSLSSSRDGTISDKLIQPQWRR